MVDLIKIQYEGAEFTIPKRDDVDDWKMWISIWLNEGCMPEQVQKTVNRHIKSDSIKLREKKLNKLLDDENNS